MQRGVLKIRKATSSVHSIFELKRTIYLHGTRVRSQYKTIYEKPKVSIQIIKNAKRNRYKRTNEQTNTDTLETPMTFSQGN